MTASHVEEHTRTCCGSIVARLSVSEALESGMRRNRRPPLAIRGAECADADGQTAAFSLDTADGIVTAVGFRVSPCATLIAYCEVAARMAERRNFVPRALTAAELVDIMPGVPPAKQQRAVLAVAALRAALAAATAVA